MANMKRPPANFPQEAPTPDRTTVKGEFAFEVRSVLRTDAKADEEAARRILARWLAHQIQQRKGEVQPCK